MKYHLVNVTIEFSATIIANTPETAMDLAIAELREKLQASEIARFGTGAPRHGFDCRLKGGCVHEPIGRD